MGRFQDKVCLVTGATSGIGRATAVRLASEGGLVAALGRNEQEGKSLMAEIKKAGGQVLFIKADVGTDADDLVCQPTGGGGRF